MTAKKKIEYGLVIAPVGQIDTDSSLSKRTLFERVEAEYPSADGWKVVQRETILNPAGGTYIMVYHLEKENG